MENKELLSKGIMGNILEKLRLEKGDKSYTLRKILFFSLVLWLPMLILSIIENTAVSSSVNIPFLHDYVIYSRFFIALPILFFTERIVKYQTDNTIKYFLDSGIIADNNVEEFQLHLTKSLKLRDSKILKVIILLIACYIVFNFWKSFGGYDQSSWMVNKAGVPSLSYAGYWYYFVAAPVYQIFLYLLLSKYLIWASFLWKISRMKLNIFPTNPDLSAGLGFLGYSLISFAFIGFAQSSVLSGEIANKIAFMGGTLGANRLMMIGSVIGLSFIYLFPSFFFISRLYLLKLRGILEYGVLTSKQSNIFFNKWVKGKYDEFLDTGDFSSLTDLNTSYDIIQKMRLIPVEPRKILIVLLIIAIPYVPLAFLAFPSKDIFEFLLKIFM
jgi:hypothetical protein